MVAGQMALFDVDAYSRSREGGGRDWAREVSPRNLPERAHTARSLVFWGGASGRGRGGAGAATPPGAQWAAHPCSPAP